MPVLLGPQPLPQVVLSRDLGRNAAREAAAAGLVRVSHGAFVPTLPAADRWQQADHLARARVMAAAHRLSAETVFSHESAALVHGLWLLRAPAAVHVVQSRRPRRQTPGLQRRVAELSDQDVTRAQGLRVTTVERTIVDCAKTLHPRDALVVADAGMRLLVAPGREDRAVVGERAEALRDRLLAAVEQGARRGRRQARAVIAHADPFSESPYETVIRWVAVSHGLPRPVLQQRFEIRGRTYYTDLCWYFELDVDGARFYLLLLAEYDGEAKYLVGSVDAGAEAARAVIAEKNREDDLRSMPHAHIARFDRREAYRSEAVFRRLCAALPAAYVASLRPVPELSGMIPPRRPPK